MLFGTGSLAQDDDAPFTKKVSKRMLSCAHYSEPSHMFVI